MSLSDENGNASNVQKAVAILAESEALHPELVQELLKPELTAWIHSLGNNSQPIHELRTKLKNRLPNKVDLEGLDRAEAALHLGMTDESFSELLKKPWVQLNSHLDSTEASRFFKIELDFFADGFLPRWKTWSSRTTMLRELFLSLEARMNFIVEPQNCEIDDCPRLADADCANPVCRTGLPPRKICVVHREPLRNPPLKSLCAECVPRVLRGDLFGKFEISGSEERLMREYP